MISQRFLAFSLEQNHLITLLYLPLTRQGVRRCWSEWNLEAADLRLRR